MLRPRSVVSIFLVAMMVLVADIAPGQDYPSKTIRIFTSAAGGGNDFTARRIAQGISGPLDQPVVVENRTAIPAIEGVTKAPPDGYTLLVGGGSVWIRTLLSKKMSYDPVRDLSPVTLTDSVPNLVVVHPSMPVKSIKELIAFAKARPGQINYGGGEVGSIYQMMGEMFKSMAGVNMVYVAYKGGGPAAIALHSGEVQLMFTITVMGSVRSGKLRALATTGSKPSALFPDLPTVSATLPGYVLENIATVMAPAKTPEATIRRLNQEIVRFLTRPEVKKRFLDFGTEVIASSPEQLAAYRDADMAKISKIIKDARIPVE